MNSKESSECQEGSIRNAQGRRIMLDLDLNNPPPSENIGLSDNPQVQWEGNGYCQGHDVEIIDDDVVVISPTKFAEVQLIST